MAATWKKVIVSGSQAELASLNVNNALVTSGSLQISNAAGSVINQISSSFSSTFLSGSFSGSFYGSATGSLTGSFKGSATAQGDFTGSFSGSANLNGSFTGSFSGSIASMPPLTQGVGIVPFTYSGSSAQTVAISGAASLSTNNVMKWTGNAFANSNITDSGTLVTIGSGATSGLTVAAGGINVTGDSLFNNNLTVTGNLTVAGTASLQNSTNVLIADKFILLTDGGFVVNGAPGLASGSAFYLSSASTGNYGRFAVAYNVSSTASSVTPDEYVLTTKLSASNPSNAVPPTWGSTTNGVGNMWVNTTTSDIYIWA
jgi:hypothetical protein